MRKLFVVNFAAPPMIRKVNKYGISNLLVILHCNRHVPHFARLLQQKMKADRLEKYFFHKTTSVLGQLSSVTMSKIHSPFRESNLFCRASAKYCQLISRKIFQPKERVNFPFIHTVPMHSFFRKR